MPTPQHILNDEAQRRIISKLNKEIAEAGRLIEAAEARARTNEQYRDFWESLYKAVADNEIVRDQFFRLMVAVKMCSEEKIPGFTHDLPREPEQLDLFSVRTRYHK